MEHRSGSRSQRSRRTSHAITGDAIPSESTPHCVVLFGYGLPVTAVGRTMAAALAIADLAEAMLDWCGTVHGSTSNVQLVVAEDPEACLPGVDVTQSGSIVTTPAANCLSDAYLSKAIDRCPPALAKLVHDIRDTSLHLRPQFGIRVCQQIVQRHIEPGPDRFLAELQSWLATVGLLAVSRPDELRSTLALAGTALWIEPTVPTSELAVFSFDECNDLDLEWFEQRLIHLAGAIWRVRGMHAYTALMELGRDAAKGTLPPALIRKRVTRLIRHARPEKL